MHAWNMFVYVYEFLVYISRQLCFHYHIARFSFVIFFWVVSYVMHVQYNEP